MGAAAIAPLVRYVKAFNVMRDLITGSDHSSADCACSSSRARTPRSRLMLLQVELSRRREVRRAISQNEWNGLTGRYCELTNRLEINAP